MTVDIRRVINVWYGHPIPSRFVRGHAGPQVHAVACMRLARLLGVAYSTDGGEPLAREELFGMNVNIWDVNDQLSALVRSGKPVSKDMLADSSVPLESLA